MSQLTFAYWCLVVSSMAVVYLLADVIDRLSSIWKIKRQLKKKDDSNE